MSYSDGQMELPCRGKKRKNFIFMHIGDKLTAINECIMNDDGRSTLTKGRVYLIADIDEVDMDFCVIDDEGDPHWFPISESDIYFTKNK